MIASFKVISRTKFSKSAFGESLKMCAPKVTSQICFVNIVSYYGKDRSLNPIYAHDMNLYEERTKGRAV